MWITECEKPPYGPTLLSLHLCCSSSSSWSKIRSRSGPESEGWSFKKKATVFPNLVPAASLDVAHSLVLPVFVLLWDPGPAWSRRIAMLGIRTPGFHSPQIASASWFGAAQSVRWGWWPPPLVWAIPHFLGASSGAAVASLGVSSTKKLWGTCTLFCTGQSFDSVWVFFYFLFF